MPMANEKITCTYDSKFDEKSQQDIQKCKEWCDEKQECRFFFLDDKGYCILHSSCIRTRAPTNDGYTYEKIIGNDI